MPLSTVTAFLVVVLILLFYVAGADPWEGDRLGRSGQQIHLVKPC